MSKAKTLGPSGSRRARWHLVPVAVSLLAIGGSACAMHPRDDQAWNCSVEKAEKLSPEIGGADAVCSTIKNAAMARIEPSRLNSAAVTIRVRVESEHKISAVATIDGKALAKQNVAISDRVLAPSSIQMLADAVAAEIARALS